jgi:hypothetical protein
MIGCTHEQSSNSSWYLKIEFRPPYLYDAKSSISTTIYGIACRFGAAADMEELLTKKVAMSTEQIVWGLQINTNTRPNRP